MIVRCFRRRQHMVEHRKTGQIVLNILFIFLCVIALAPFLMIISSSVSSENLLSQYGYSFYPRGFTWDTYIYLFQSSSRIIRGIGISVMVTATGTSLAMLLTVLFGYALSRKSLPFRNFFSFMIFFTMLFNGGLVPTYIMYTQQFHIRDTVWALIVPALLMNAFYVIMMRSYFTASIPESLIEAAKIDGAGEYRVLWSVVLPVSKPMLATIALMIGLGYWNDWTNSLYYISDAKFYSLQAILNNIMNNMTFLMQNSRNISQITNTPSTGMRMAIAVIGILPVLCIYPFFQKYFVKGIVVGGVKG